MALLELYTYERISEIVHRNNEHQVSHIIQNVIDDDDAHEIFWQIVDLCQDYKNFALLETAIREYITHKTIPSHIIPMTIECFDLFIKYKWTPKPDVLLYACLEDNYVAIKWLIEHGYRNDKMMFVPSNATPKTIALCHRLNIPAGYMEECKSGNCELCNRVTEIGESWRMDTPRFENMVQWLPLEITEDVVSLMVVF